MKLKPKMLWALLLIMGLSACTQEQYYTKRVDFEPNESLDSKLLKAGRLVPTPQQLAWQKQELTAFIHFGINTFTDVEWGHGDENPQDFNPSDLDCEQWVKVLKDAGMKLVIITAKHHDGFCLWPTKTTKHSVASSPWKDGKGDVVMELRKACDKLGMRFGVYLSPWDMNAEVYGQGKAYDDFFKAQLTELLTNYGVVDEVWFDGANGEGPNGKKQVYDWDAYYDLIAKLQPDAVTAVVGEDVRWVGTESGYGRETEWSATPMAPGGRKAVQNTNPKLKLGATSEDLGSKELLKDAETLFWFPSEVDVSVRPGWFYHKSQDSQVKSLAKVVDIYYNSVGRNSVLLLNIPPDKRGLIHENDVKALQGLGNYIENTFNKGKVLENKQLTKLEAGQSITLNIPDEPFNVLLMQEDISKGQRIAQFKAEVLINGNWEELLHSTTVGYKKLKRLPTTQASKLRITVLETRGTSQISKIGLYKAQEIISEPQVSRNRVGTVTVTTLGQASLVYTLDGSEPTKDSEPYTKALDLPLGGTLKLKVFADNYSRSSDTYTHIFDICPEKWSVVSYSDEVPRYEATNAIDGNPQTMWHTPWTGNLKKHPHHLVVDLGEKLELKGFTYTPRADPVKSGTAQRYSFYVSMDGKKFRKVLNNKMFNNIKNNPIKQFVRFGKSYPARYIKFESLSEIENKGWVSVGELGVITR